MRLLQSDIVWFAKYIRPAPMFAELDEVVAACCR
jgi:hypothetical protein